MKTSSKFIRLSLVVGWLVAMAIAFAPQVADAANSCVSQSTGNWISASTWTNCNSGTPGNDDSATIQNGHVVTLDGSGDYWVNLVTVNGGGTLILARPIGIWGTSFKVDGTLQINSGGGVLLGKGGGKAPTYGSSSLLKYNPSGTYGRALEWSATSGAGYPANVQISNSTTLNLGSGQCSMAGNLTIDIGSTLNLGAGNGNHLNVGGSVDIAGTLTLPTGMSDLRVGGNWNRTGTFTPNGSIVDFNSTTAGQTINGATTFDRLTISNSTSAGVTMNADVMVNIDANISGLLYIGGNTLTIASGGSISGAYGATKMVVADGNGYLKKISNGTLSSFTFPVGDTSGDYSPVTLDCGTSIASDSYAQVKLTDAKHAKMAGTDYISRYWTMTSDDSGVNCTGTFQYVDGDVNGVEGNIVPVKWNGTVWSPLTSGSVNVGANTLTGSFTSFSDFSGGNWGTLAVDLALFTANAARAGVTLAWETVSETDNAGFNVYRAGSEAGPWTRLNAALIPAATPGASGGHAYTWIDATAAANTAYVYRLEAVALDGSAEIMDTLGVTYRPAQRRWLPLAR